MYFPLNKNSYDDYGRGLHIDQLVGFLWLHSSNYEIEKNRSKRSSLDLLVIPLLCIRKFQLNKSSKLAS